MNVTLTPEGYTQDGTMRLVPVGITDEINAAIKGEMLKNLDAMDFRHEYAMAIKSAPNPPKSLSPWQPITTPIENGRRVFVASITRMGLFYGQFREYPFPRVVANDGGYITEFYAWMYEPELPPLPEPAP